MKRQPKANANPVSRFPPGYLLGGAPRNALRKLLNESIGPGAALLEGLEGYRAQIQRRAPREEFVDLLLVERPGEARRGLLASDCDDAPEETPGPVQAVGRASRGHRKTRLADRRNEVNEREPDEWIARPMKTVETPCVCVAAVLVPRD